MHDLILTFNFLASAWDTGNTNIFSLGDIRKRWTETLKVVWMFGPSASVAIGGFCLVSTSRTHV